jgi:hypothetical protein
MASISDILQGGLQGLKAPIEEQVKQAAMDEVKHQLLPLAYGAAAIVVLVVALKIATPMIAHKE